MERLSRNEINFSIKSRMMDMRKAVNHPYLIDYPVMEDGMYFRYRRYRVKDRSGTKWLVHCKLCVLGRNYSRTKCVQYSLVDSSPSVVDPKLFIPDPDPALNIPSSGSGSRQKFRIQLILIR